MRYAEPAIAADAASGGAPMTLHPYVALGLAVTAEVIGTLALKASDGMTRMPASLIVVAGYGVAFWLLSHVVRTMPLGVAYAVWSGVGVGLIVLASIVLYRQVPDLPAMIGIALIATGVIVIHLFSKMAVH
jgi:small multidrug resistance pump